MSPSPTAAPEHPLRAFVRGHAENRPGVYRMYGPGDELLYVGKSIRIRTRLLSYFRAEPGEKAFELVRESTRIQWDHIPDEFGALVREMRLIQQHRPRYNVQHKRKRSYGFVKITREPAPRVVPASTVIEDGATYYGPFPRVGQVSRTIRDLAHVLGIRDCPGATPMYFADQLDIFGADRAPLCIRAELASCPAPCAGAIDAAGYMERVREAARFLEGRSRLPLHLLQEEMTTAAARLDFEYAAAVRDRLERLRRLQQELTAFRGEVESLRFVYRAEGHGGRDRLHLIRGGRIRASFDDPRSTREWRAAARTSEAVFGAVEPGPAGLSAHEAAEILLVARWFRLNPEEIRRTTAPERWRTEAVVGDELPVRGAAASASRGKLATPSAPVAQGRSVPA